MFQPPNYRSNPIGFITNWFDLHWVGYSIGTISYSGFFHKWLFQILEMYFFYGIEIILSKVVENKRKYHVYIACCEELLKRETGLPQFINSQTACLNHSRLFINDMLWDGFLGLLMKTWELWEHLGRRWESSSPMTSNDFLLIS